MASPTGIVRIRFRMPDRRDVEAAGRLAMERAALQAVSGIVRATAKGIDGNGRQFVAYTRAYANAKQASGRKIVPPDLTLTGTMLRALRVLRVESTKRAVIGWEGQHVTRTLVTKKGDAFSRLDSRRTIRKRGLSSKQMQSVPYATLVPALNRKRRFFFIGRELAKKIRDVYMKTLREGVARSAGSGRSATRL